jgi:hypothetical protein
MILFTYTIYTHKFRIVSLLIILLQVWSVPVANTLSIHPEYVSVRLTSLALCIKPVWHETEYASVCS